jgi:dienelactone hydrolase
MVPVTVDGEKVKLATITYKPGGNGPFPTLIFHHGSTGRGNDPTAFARPYNPTALVQWFTERGWAVILPSRRGRGGSEGLYDEGFGTNRSYGYTCEETLALPGADRALRDIDAITPVLLAQPFVDRSRVVIGGQSRGGILAIAWTGRHPTVARAAINFVGGWMSDACSSASSINQKLFKRGVPFASPSIWLYGENDPFYKIAHSLANFAAFQSAGGRGTFHEYAPPSGLNGHQINTAPALWSATLETYLEERRLPGRRQ